VEVPKRAIDITAENAKVLRELFRQSIETTVHSKTCRN
jgi:ribosomal protein S10